jgi:hypothetical protein
MKSTSFQKNAKGAAGVHFVVAELSMRGYVALPTTRNLKSVDVVAFNEHLNRFAFIQVKSTDKPKGGWPVHSIKKEDGWESDIRIVDFPTFGGRAKGTDTVIPRSVSWRSGSSAGSSSCRR